MSENKKLKILTSILLVVSIFSLFSLNIYSASSNVNLIGELGGEARDVFVVGNYAYVATGISGLKIIDISNKSSPKQVRIL
jgi:hypothetical protein